MFNDTLLDYIVRLVTSNLNYTTIVGITLLPAPVKVTT